MNIKAILYSDVYRPMAFGLVSVLLVYCVRNDKMKKQFAVYGVYLLYMMALFAGFMFLAVLANGSLDITGLLWGTKRICFLLVITIVQHFVYKIFGKRKDIGLLIINAAAALVVCYIVMRYFI